MQGLTGHVYRAAYLRHFAGVDRCYCPYVRLRGGRLRARDERELVAGRESGEMFTPQIIAATPTEAAALCEAVVARGHRRVNFNLGCPNPMKTKRKKGAGLLPYPGDVEAILETLCQFEPALRVSVKTRLGLELSSDFAALVPVFNRFPLDAVIVHPRTAKQMYTGLPDWWVFGEQAQLLKAPVVANGDILSPGDAQRLLETFPWIAGLMIGRGLLRDPFLPAAIKGHAVPASRLADLRRFHDELVEAHRQMGMSAGHILDKMRPLWSYFAHSFAEPARVAKRFRKVRRMDRYQSLVEELFP